MSQYRFHNSFKILRKLSFISYQTEGEFEWVRHRFLPISLKLFPICKLNKVWGGFAGWLRGKELTGGEGWCWQRPLSACQPDFSPLCSRFATFRSDFAEKKDLLPRLIVLHFIRRAAEQGHRQTFSSELSSVFDPTMLSSSTFHPNIFSSIPILHPSALSSVLSPTIFSSTTPPKPFYSTQTFLRNISF